MTPRLVLASGSPRRRELLSGLDLEFAVRPTDCDETPLPGEGPAALVARLALAKAETAARPGELALGADTVVVVDGEILGKPADPDHAESMLARIAGRTHLVWTGVALVDRSRPTAATAVRAVSTEVDVRPLRGEEIAWYVATGEPLDKAGAYGIQGWGALLVEAVRGNYFNVVGLPLPTVAELAAELGHDLRSFIRRT